MPTVNETYICNLALVDGLGVSAIESIDDNTNNIAINCKLLYSNLRDALLEETPWSFARSEIALAPITNQWITYTKAYSYPNDCLKIIYLWNGLMGDVSTSTEFDYSHVSIWQNMNRVPRDIAIVKDASGNETGQKAILCDLDEAYLVYIKAITNPSLFSSLFVRTLAMKLAMSLWSSVNTSSEIYQRVSSEYEKNLALAKRSASSETLDNSRQISSYEAFRF